MKTYKNLYPQVWAWDNLYLAYRRARRGKRGRLAVAAFEWDLEGNLVRLQDGWCCPTCLPFGRKCRPAAAACGRGYETRRGLFPAARYRRAGKYITTLPPVVGRFRRFDAWGGVNSTNCSVKFLLSSLQGISDAVF
jgi:hypothetical protein